MSPGWRLRASVLGFAGVLGVGAASSVLAASGITGQAAWDVEVLVFVPLLVVASSLFLRVQHRDHILALDLFEAVLAPAVFILPAPSLLATVVVAVAAAEVIRRNTPLKATFNVAQWAAAAGAGNLVLAKLSTDGGVANHLLPLVAAMAVVAMVNTAAFVLVVRIAQGRSVVESLRSSGPLIAINWAITTPVGLVFAAAYATAPVLGAVFLLPLVLLHVSGRALSAARVDTVRLKGLHSATAELYSPINPRDALPRFMDEVRACFEAEAVEVLLVDGQDLTVHVLDPGAEQAYTVRSGAPGELAHVLLQVAPVRVNVDGDAALAPLVAEAGWRGCIAAPVGGRGSVRGVVAIYNRAGLEGFEDGELSVLEALARELGAALDKAGLLETVLEERAKLSDIVSNASDGIVTLTAEGVVTSWNPGMERITGYAADAVLGRRGFSVLRPRDDSGRDVDVEEWATHDRPLPGDLQVLTEERQDRWLSCSYTRVTPADGGQALLVVVARDTTRAHELEKLRDDFVSTVSHELRTPLTPIKGFASTLLEHGDRLPAAQRDEALRLILRQAQRLEDLIVNLLEVTKIEGSRAASLPDAVVDVAGVVEDVVRDFRSTFPDRVVTVSSAPGFCGAHGNEVWIERILTNLVSNAIKYAPADEPIRVEVTMTPDHLELRVSDAGPGIPASEQERIFDRFERLDHAHIQPGTGLGLYLARRLAGTMGGTLTVESHPGVGSTFTLRLPVASRLVAVSSNAS